MSLPTVKRARQDLGWVINSPKYCQLIRDANKTKRLVWCEKMIAEKESFDNVIFTDESSVALETHRKRCYRRKDEPRKLKPRPKHPVKVHVWGGISKRGATPIAIFTGIMTAVRYTEILESALIPFIQEAFPDEHRFQQDNEALKCQTLGGILRWRLWMHNTSYTAHARTCLVAPGLGRQWRVTRLFYAGCTSS